VTRNRIEGSVAFALSEATISSIHDAFERRDLTARQLVECYLARIEAYDRAGPRINSLITVNPAAEDDAARLDEEFAERGLTGPLHGVPVVVKDQIDAVGLPTTLGSVLFEDYLPDQDATVIGALRRAGAIVLGKATLGELGGGDAHGTLFGSTRNPYDLERTAGGSSGGSAAALAANLAAVALGQEGVASIRRPSAWNSVVGMRPSLGMVSRAGSYGGFPARNGSIGPMARTVEDLARLLDVLVGYDRADPTTAHGVRCRPASFAAGLSPEGLRGVRVGIIRQPIGLRSDPDAADYRAVTAVFDRAVDELAAAGAVVVDRIEIPGLDELLRKRSAAHSAESFTTWMSRSSNPPFRSYDEFTGHPVYREVMWRRSGGGPPDWDGTHLEHLLAQEELLTRLLVLMAELELDVFVHKSVEHTPTLIREGVNPPYRNLSGAPHINTFLEKVPAISVPAGFTDQGLPAGITFLGAPYTDGSMVRYAYAYEQATRHRVLPATTPPLPSEPRG
jgi:Asp-tRNA(Asn)/Glu-tRNA(Gln) amidotransferase A subunit family amidase